MRRFPAISKRLRIPALAVCLFRRELRSNRLWQFSAALIGLTLIESLIIPLMSRRSPDVMMLYVTLQIVSLIAAAVVPVIVASDTIEDGPSGVLELLCLARLSAWHWIAVRLLAIALVYVTLLLVRLPLLVLCQSLGVSTASLLRTECALAGFALSSGVIGLDVATRTLSRQAVIMTALGALGGLEALCFLPRLLSLLFPGLTTAGDWMMSAPAPLAISSGFLGKGQAPVWPCVLVHALAAMVLLPTVARGFHRLLATATPGASTAVSSSRSPRRIPDDALAWHAAVFCLRDNMTRGRRLAGWSQYGALGILAALRPEWRAPLLALMSLTFAMSLRFVPALCIQLEITQHTLPSLAILPQGGRGLYEGWIRGGLTYWRSCYALAALAMALSAWFSPWEALAWIPLVILHCYATPPVMFVATLKALEKTTANTIRRMVVGGTTALLAFNVGFPIAILAGGIYSLVMRPSALRAIDEEVERAACRA